MAFGKKLVVAALCLMAGRVAQAADMFISLRPAAEMDGRSIRLMDIADIAVRDDAIGRQLGGIEIIKLTSLTAPITLSREAVTQQLSQRGGVSAKAIVWGGSENVVVRAMRHSVDLTTHVNRVATMLIDAMSDSGGRLSLTLVDDGGVVEAPRGQLSAHPDMPSIRQRGSSIEVPLIVEVDNQTVATPLLRFSVSRRVLANASDSDREEPAMHNEKTFASAKAAERTEQTDSIVAVEKNHPVSILLKAGSVEVESSGIALADASAGEELRVRRISNGLVMSGRATANGMVVVEEK